MFDPCKFVDYECPFSIEGKWCGLGKGESLIDDIKSCDGKHPKYTKKFLDKLALENAYVKGIKKQKSAKHFNTSSLF